MKTQLTARARARVIPRPGDFFYVETLDGRRVQLCLDPWARHLFDDNDMICIYGASLDDGGIYRWSTDGCQFIILQPTEGEPLQLAEKPTE